MILELLGMDTIAVICKVIITGNSPQFVWSQRMKLRKNVSRGREHFLKVKNWFCQTWILMLNLMERIGP